MHKCFSFDIFDTCLTRSCGSGDNVMFLLARKVLREKNDSLLKEFVKRRKDAEFSAMKHLNKEAVNINEIYEYFDTLFFSNIPKNEILTLEIEIEKTSFLPIKKTLQIIEKCRKKGKVLFISDMYLPTDILYSSLLSLGIIKKGESLYVSGSIGLTKRSGKLYDYVKEAEKLNGFRWTHFGDDFNNDVLMSKKRGIKARHLTFHNSLYEKMWENETVISNNIAPSILAGLTRSIRLNNYVSNRDEFASNLMAPLLTTFTLSLIKDAKKRKIKKLYFAARDMFLPYSIAKEYIGKNQELELHYLHISTKVSYPTFIVNGTEEEVRHILGLLHDFTPASILKMFDFDEKDINEFGSHLNLYQSLSVEKGTAELFIKELLNEKNKNIIIENCCKKRNLFLEYLNQEGFLSDKDNVALVDIGWRCTTQDVLNKLISNKSITYYYYGVSSDRLQMKDIGQYFSFSYNDQIKDSLYYQFIIEYYICRVTEGSTIGFTKDKDGVVSPIFEKVKNDDINDIIYNKTIVLKYAKLFHQYDILIDNAELLLYNCAIRSLVDFLYYPQFHLVKKISPYLYFNHFGFRQKIIYGRKDWKFVPFLAKKILKKLHIIDINTSNIWWKRGTLVNIFGPIGYISLLFKRINIFSS